jgi:hypothetical protein
VRQHTARFPVAIDAFAGWRYIMSEAIGYERRRRILHNRPYLIVNRILTTSWTVDESANSLGYAHVELTSPQQFSSYRVIRTRRLDRNGDRAVTGFGAGAGSNHALLVNVRTECHYDRDDLA